MLTKVSVVNMCFFILLLFLDLHVCTSSKYKEQHKRSMAGHYGPRANLQAMFLNFYTYSSLKKKSILFLAQNAKELDFRSQLLSKVIGNICFTFPPPAVSMASSFFFYLPSFLTFYPDS